MAKRDPRLFTSPSKLRYINTDLDACERCFWLEYNKGVARPKGILATLMGGMDKILKLYFGKFRGTLPPELKGRFEGKLYEHVTQLAVWQNAWKGLEFFFEDRGIGLRGAVDDIGIAPDGSFVPLDFKTRGYPLKPGGKDYYRLQLDCYVLLLKMLGFPVNNTAYLIYYWPHNVSMADAIVQRNSVIDFDTEVVKYENLDGSFALERLKRAKELLTSDVMPEAHPSCEYCNQFEKRQAFVLDYKAKPEPTSQIQNELEIVI